MLPLRSLTFTILAVCSCHAEIRLPALFSDHAVLQRSGKTPVWGKALPGEKVRVQLGEITQEITTDAEGRWRVNLDLSGASSGLFTMSVSGNSSASVSISDVLVGEVWLASGQSNMELHVNDLLDADRVISQSANPQLREFQVGRVVSHDPLEDCLGRWIVAGPETTGNFGAVGYFFGKRVQEDLKAPVGILHASWGGTPVEAWTNAGAYADVPELAGPAQKMRATVAESPALLADYGKAFGEWLAKTGREDRPAMDVSAYVGDAEEKGWISVSLPGEGRASGLPENGAVWFRRIVDVPAADRGQNFAIGLGPLEGFETVYWNGQLVHQMTYEKFPGQGHWRWIYLPASAMRKGANTLALRVYNPSGPIHFPVAPRVCSVVLDGTWKARMEYELPTLAAGETAPTPPPAPPRSEDTAGYLYGGMIAPLVPYGLRGVIWYQGESNTPRAFQYRKSFPLLIESWRNAWENNDLPFYFCQLANYLPKQPQPGESAWAELRESQQLALNVPRTGQAVLMDLGEMADIHPRNKADVGDRLARLALAEQYGKPIVAAAPTFRSVEIKDDKAIVHFDLKESQLVAAPMPAIFDVSRVSGQTAPLVRNSPKSELEGFAICGFDRKWVWADARIEGDTVIAWSKDVPKPYAVRYAWADNPTFNLYGSDGLPVGAFRSDRFPISTQSARY